MARTKQRIYWRERGGQARAYADFRDYSDVGGRREALVPKGARLATTDAVVAEVLAGERVADLEGKRRNKTVLGATGALLGEYAMYHLRSKAEAGRTSERYLVNAEHYLRRAVEYFGEDRALDSISVRDVEAWMNHLTSRSNGRGKSLSGGTARHHLNAVSNLYRRAIGEGVVPVGFNPPAGVMEKPQGSRREARWLEPHEVALLLEAARVWEPTSLHEFTAVTFHALLSTLALTGGRFSEIAGLLVTDIRFDRKTVAIRSHPHRRLKTEGSARVIPLWPQLRATLRDYLLGREEADDGLLFPAPRTGGILRDIRKPLDAVAMTAGWDKGEIRPHQLRHSYCAQRLQSLDHGAPVSTFTVSRELGHKSERLVREVYSHLGDVRHRSEVVEFKIDQHRGVLGDRLEALLEGRAS